MEQHEETDYFFNVSVGIRAGGNGAGSVGAATAVAECGTQPACSECRASSAYSECGTPPDNAYLFGHSDDEGAIVLRTSCYAEYADCGDAVRNSAAACLWLRCEPF